MYTLGGFFRDFRPPEIPTPWGSPSVDPQTSPEELGSRRHGSACRGKCYKHSPRRDAMLCRLGHFGLRPRQLCCLYRAGTVARRELEGGAGPSTQSGCDLRSVASVTGGVWYCFDISGLRPPAIAPPVYLRSDASLSDLGNQRPGPRPLTEIALRCVDYNAATLAL
jgi:hypothetical protein